MKTFDPCFLISVYMWLTHESYSSNFFFVSRAGFSVGKIGFDEITLVVYYPRLNLGRQSRWPVLQVIYLRDQLVHITLFTQQFVVNVQLFGFFFSFVDKGEQGERFLPFLRCINAVFLQSVDWISVPFQFRSLKCSSVSCSGFANSKFWITSNCPLGPTSYFRRNSCRWIWNHSHFQLITLPGLPKFAIQKNILTPWNRRLVIASPLKYVER